MKLKSLATLAFTSLLSVSAWSQTEFAGGTSDDMWGEKTSVHVFKDGKFTWKVDGELMVGGSYSQFGKYLVITDESGPRACTDDKGEHHNPVGIYIFETYENSSYLLPVEDDCGGRIRGFVAMRLVK